MDLRDIEDAVHLVHQRGERFEGWYFSKRCIRKEVMRLNYEGRVIDYEFDIYDYNYRFIMPSYIEFSEGMISYTDGERQAGVFRFPRDKNGRFIAPISLDKDKMRELLNLSEEQLSAMLSMKNPLVFEAFRIPQFGFELFEPGNKLKRYTEKEFFASVNKFQSLVIKEKTAEIEERILLLPNYLLILRNLLNRQCEDFEEIALITDKILHI